VFGIVVAHLLDAAPASSRRMKVLMASPSGLSSSVLGTPVDTSSHGSKIARGSALRWSVGSCASARSRQEVEHDGYEVIRLVGHRHVSGAGEYDELSTRDDTLILPSQPGQHDRVALTPNQKRGRLDRRELAAESVVAEELPAGSVHRQGASAQRVAGCHPEQLRSCVTERGGDRQRVLACALAFKQTGWRD